MLAVSLAATFRPAEMVRRWSLLRRSLAGETITAGTGTGFWFDPAYARFLEAVRQRTPPNATIVFLVPPRPDVYVYEAAYQLAPRRVVAPDREAEASWVAAYRYQYRDLGNPDAVAIPGGALFKRR